MKKIRIAAALILLTIATPALAHPGHGENAGFIGGLLHPLTGMDHLAAMLMVGLFAGLQRDGTRAAGPIAFVAAMVGGFGFGVAGVALPLAEPLILLSLAGLAGMIALELRGRRDASFTWALPVIALFGAAHGFAHGSEMPAGGDALGFGAGFVLVTATLHAIGFGIARMVRGLGFAGQTAPVRERQGRR